MNPAWVIAAAVCGVALGPIVHHLGVRAGLRAPFEGILPRCESCGTSRWQWWVRRCGTCREPIRKREPLIAVAMGVGFVGSVWLAGTTWLLPAHIWFVGLSSVLVITDFDHKLIPNRVLYPGTAVAAGMLAMGAVAEGRGADLGRAGIVAAVYFGLLLVVALVAQGGFGMGDVKLAVVIGLFLGFWGFRVFANGLFLTGLAGGLPAVYLMLRRRGGRGTEIPYGPAMVLGAWAALGLAAAGIV